MKWYAVHPSIPLILQIFVLDQTTLLEISIPGCLTELFLLLFGVWSWSYTEHFITNKWMECTISAWEWYQQHDIIPFIKIIGYILSCFVMQNPLISLSYCTLGLWDLSCFPSYFCYKKAQIKYSRPVFGIFSRIFPCFILFQHYLLFIIVFLSGYNMCISVSLWNNFIRQAINMRMNKRISKQWEVWKNIN